MRIEKIRLLALSFPETSEQPHFEKTSFRVGKKIFATYDQVNNRLCIKLNEIDQHAFSAFDKTTIYPVPNKWGQQGWTFIELNTVNEDALKDAVIQAYIAVAPKKLGELVKV